MFSTLLGAEQCLIYFFSSHSQAECAMVVCRFCVWPQELMLRLEGTADLHQIQILSHEYKVLLQYLPCLVLLRKQGRHLLSVSPSNVQYPDEIIVWLQIASKVELHIGTQSGETVSWKRLGSFSFDSNDRSKLQARELKSVTVSVQALLIRIVLARCHTNSQNIYKQVPIVHAACQCIQQQVAACTWALLLPPRTYWKPA